MLEAYIIPQFLQVLNRKPRAFSLVFCFVLYSLIFNVAIAGKTEKHVIEIIVKNIEPNIEAENLGRIAGASRVKKNVAKK